MGLSASQGRMLLLTARKSDLEFRAQQISQKRLILSQQLEEIASDYEDSTSNRQMKIMQTLTSVGTDGEKTTRATNLTWIDLISGTLKSMSSDISGIKCSENDVIGDYTSNIFYRLVDVNGAIVVSSEDEIPNMSFKAKKTKATEYVDSDNATIKNVYTTTNKDQSGNVVSTVNYLQANNDLKKLLGDGNDKQKTVVIDTSEGVVIVKDANSSSTSYYKLDGTKQDKNFKYNGSANNQISALLVNNAKKRQGVEYESEVLKEGTEKIEGGDGVITIIKENGVSQRYIVDPSLRLGSTDGSGSTSGPNYIQDCIRNGKYLLQRYNSSAEKWSSIEWDAASNISDSYYTDDDDKAKAKYDRLQTQIQAQDKKLELELDNVETQRTAVNTEMDSVDKVINDNIDKSFKTFA